MNRKSRHTSLFAAHCPFVRCRRAGACRAGKGCVCAGRAALRGNLLKRMMRLTAVLSAMPLRATKRSPDRAKAPRQLTSNI